MRDLLEGLSEALPVSLIPYALFFVGAVVTGLFFALARILNRKE